MAIATRLQVHRIAGALGAEIHGVDLARDTDDTTIAGIREALLEHCVVFFRDQTLDADQLKRLARRFGDIFVHPNYVGLQADPEIVEIRREPGDTRIVGEDWHTDTTMMPDRKVAGPKSGANVGRSTKARDDDTWRETVSVHPVVRTHPETGRKLLFVNKAYTVGFEGMTEAESAPLLEFLLEHGHRPEFTCRFRWAKGSVTFWDNRSVKHLAVNDAGPYRRHMRRVQIAGDRPR